MAEDAMRLVSKYFPSAAIFTVLDEINTFDRRVWHSARLPSCIGVGFNS